MEDVTTLLYDLDGFRVVSVQRRDGDGREVVVHGVEEAQGCPDCGVLSRRVHVRKTRRVKDLPHGQRRLVLWWDQRRFACDVALCSRKTFAETSVQIGRGRRAAHVNGRLSTFVGWASEVLPNY